MDSQNMNHELTEKLEPFIAELGSEEAQDEIGETHDGHVSLIWEDGEVTSTKNGDLFGHRSLHQRQMPWLPRNEVLWEVPDSTMNPFTSSHECRVITDNEACDIIRQYMEENDYGPVFL